MKVLLQPRNQAAQCHKHC